MKKSSVLFVIPTLFNNPNLVDSCVINLSNNLKNFDIDYKIVVVINSESSFFTNYKFPVNVEKCVSDRQYNIARALNMACKENKNYDYFCFFDEGIIIENNNWVNYIINFFDNNNKCGIFGGRAHSTFEKFNIKVSENPEIYEVLWSDGILFTKMNLLESIDGFDEIFYADCELQDFCYRIREKGYKNYFWKGLIKSHKTLPAEKKVRNDDNFLKIREKTLQIFDDRWKNLKI